MKVFKFFSVWDVLLIFGVIMGTNLVVIGAIAPGPLLLRDVIYSALSGLVFSILPLWLASKKKQQQDKEYSQKKQ